MATKRLYVVGADSYGCPSLREVFKRGQSFVIDEDKAEQMLKATKKDKANNYHPVLAEAGDPLAERWEKAEKEAAAEQAKKKPNQSSTTQRRSTRKKPAGKQASV